MVLLGFGQQGAANVAEEESAGLQEHFIHFTVGGSWQAVESLIMALENSSRIIGVESLASSEDQDEIQFGLQLKVYSY